MLRGTVSFQAAIKGDNRVTFPRLEFNTNEPGIEKATIEASGFEILTKIHFASVASEDDALTRATRVNTAALNRIAFHHSLVIDDANITDQQLSSVEPSIGPVIKTESGAYRLTGRPATMLHGLLAATVKAELEAIAPPGEHHYGLFRFVMRAESPVEEFMFWYGLLLRFFNDSQENVDKFIVGADPTVPTTPSPRKVGASETVYTRLRNEVGHHRPGATPEKTRDEVAKNIAGLRALTRRAIASHP